MNLNLLQRLTEAQGVPGREERVRRLVIEELSPLTDEITVDALGNVIAHKRGTGPKVMIAAHLDEIGFLVRHVDDQGFLRLEPLGGFDPKTLVAQRVTVHTETEDLTGVIGTTPVHVLTEEERKKPLELKALFVDLGLEPEQVKAKVQIGDFVTLEQTFKRMGDLVTAKAIDDRVGVFVMIEALRALQDHQADIYAVATVQEEVGLRGARVSAFGVAPDIGIALDVTVAADVPGSKDFDRVTRLGHGVAIKIKDSSHISHPKLVRALQHLARERKILHQMEILPRGGTDAAGLQLARDGAAAITLSIPTRYLHSVVEAAHLKDIQACIDLLTAFLQVAHTQDLTL